MKPLLSKFSVIVCCLIFATVAYGQNCDAGFTAQVQDCSLVVLIPDTVDPSLTYGWNFGDGATSSEIAPSHLFTPPGNGSTNFTITLTVNGNDCNEQTTSETVTVQQVPDVSIADQTGEDFVNCVGGFITIENTSSTMSTNVNYTIDWGDGTALEETTSYNTLNHDYMTRGAYIITVTIEGANGCTAVETFPFVWSSPNLSPLISKTLFWLSKLPIVPPFSSFTSPLASMVNMTAPLMSRMSSPLCVATCMLFASVMFCACALRNGAREISKSKAYLLHVG